MSPAVASSKVVAKATPADSVATFHVITLYGQVLYGQWTYGFDGQAAVTPTISERLVTTATSKEAQL